MREAALFLALGRDDFAPSLATRAIGALLALAAQTSRRLAAARARLAPRVSQVGRLGDIGSAPGDLALSDVAIDPRAQSRSARIAGRRALRDRWSID